MKANPLIKHRPTLNFLLVACPGVRLVALWMSEFRFWMSQFQWVSSLRTSRPRASFRVGSGANPELVLSIPFREGPLGVGFLCMPSSPREHGTIDP